MPKPSPKFQVGDPVDVGPVYADAVVVRVVGYVRRQWLYQVEYTPADGHAIPGGRRHQQPWTEPQIHPRAS